MTQHESDQAATKLQLAQRVITLSGTRDVTIRTLRSVAASVNVRPEIAFGNLDVLTDKYMSCLAEAWGESFTTDQLIDLITWYSSDTGRAMVTMGATLAIKGEEIMAGLLAG